MPHSVSLISTIAAGLGLALIFGFAAARLRLPAIVGYLLAGVIIGPFTPGFVADAGIASQLTRHVLERSAVGSARRLMACAGQSWSGVLNVGREVRVLTPDQLGLVAVGLHHLEIRKIEARPDHAGHEGESIGMAGQGAGSLPEACRNDVLGLTRQRPIEVLCNTDGTQRDTACLVSGGIPRPEVKRRAFEVYPDLI